MTLGGLALVFLRLGLTGFGGPAAHVALMRDEFVRRRGWLRDDTLLDLIAAANLIPGPNSTEVAMHIGWRFHGVRGLVVAGIAFIAPAFAMVLAAAVAYVAWGATPDAAFVLAGMTPVVLAIVIDALWQFGRSAIHRPGDAVIVGAACAAVLAGVHELAILAVAAGLAPWRAWLTRSRALAIVSGLVAGTGTTLMAAAATATVPVTLAGLGAFFLRVGATLFGSGYVLLAFLRADLVERWHWLTPQQLLDAIAVGQFTPGPLFTTATFIGYLLAGYPGAVVATLAIFAPAFGFVALTAPWLASLRQSRLLAAVLDLVVLASLGLMAAVAVLLAGDTLVSPFRTGLCVASLAILAWKRVNSAWLIATGAAVGWMAGRV